jgi:hypothetical protein
MAQAEGTSKNDGKVGSSVSGASKSSPSSSLGSSKSSSSQSSISGASRSTAGKTAGSNVSSSSGSSGGSSISGASRSTAGKTSSSGKSSSSNSSGGFKSTAASIGQAIGSLLGGGAGGMIGSRVADAAFSNPTKVEAHGMMSDENANRATPKDAQEAKKRDFSGIQNATARTLAETWSGLGWSDRAIAAGLGNAQQESSFNPKARNKGDAKDGTDSLGLFQHNSSRLSAGYSYAKMGDPERGIPANSDWTDPKVQASFVDKEMKTTHKGAWNAINNATTDKAASDAWSGKFEVADPAANANRASYTKNFAKQLASLGVADIRDEADMVDDAIVGVKSLGKPVGQKPSQYNADPLGVVSFVADTLGFANPNTGKQKNGSYVDPMVSSVEGRTARNEDEPDLSAANITPTRKGIAALGDTKKPAGVAKAVVNAITDPIGFAIDSVLDLGANSRMMNTPGPEGEGGDGQFGLGFLSGFTGGAQGPYDGWSNSNSGSGDRKKPTTPVVSGSPAAPANAVEATNPLDVPDPRTALATNGARKKPFAWSTLLDDLAKGKIG